MSTIAKEIYRQLGAQRFATMTGSKNFTSTENSLRMKLTRNKAGAQYLKIELTVMDTYTMTFTKVKRTKNKERSVPGIYTAWDEKLVEVAKYENIYNDQLQEIFTSVTGLYTKF